MPEQLTLFDQPPRIAPCDTHLVKAEKPRLAGQNLAILERLQRGPATNKELAQISLKYTGRISDLRAAGYNVALVARDHATGVTMYELITKETDR